jgi:hypothetical protein
LNKVDAAHALDTTFNFDLLFICTVVAETEAGTEQNHNHEGEGCHASEPRCATAGPSLVKLLKASFTRQFVASLRLMPIDTLLNPQTPGSDTITKHGGSGRAPEAAAGASWE